MSFDFGTIILSSIAADWFYQTFAGGGNSLMDSLQIGLFAAIVFLGFMASRGAYRIDALGRVRNQVLWAVQGWLLVFLLLSWVGFLLKVSSTFSRGTVLLWLGVGLSALTVGRTIAGSWLNELLRAETLSLQRSHLVAVADSVDLCRLRAELRSHGVEQVGFTQIPPSLMGGADFAKMCRQALDDVRRSLSLERLDAVHLVVPSTRPRALDELKTALSGLPLPLVVLADADLQRLLRKPQLRVAGIPAFEVQRAPLSRAEQIAKRLMDIVIASVGLVVLSPIMLMTTLAILVETGRPIYFRQNRRGFGGRVFQIMKFRSMTVAENGAKVVQATRHDPRITLVGRVIRRTSIDELPQLINVLRGQMSIVGPRPHAVAHDDHYMNEIATYAFRHHVKPGITGWAQVNGLRGETSTVDKMAARIERDVWYINNWSLLLDIKIVLKTAMMIFFDRNAY